MQEAERGQRAGAPEARRLMGGGRPSRCNGNNNSKNDNNNNAVWRGRRRLFGSRSEPETS